MTRPTASDRACLDAQLQAQVAQRLTAELAVSCPDCGVEPGRACRDSFDRAVKTHLAREVASSKRDTVPCPGPDVEEWLKQELDRRCVFSFTTEADPYGDYLIIRHGEFYARISGKELAARSLSSGTLYCSKCTAYWTEESHALRCRRTDGHHVVDTVCFDCFRKTPTASDCAPGTSVAPDTASNGVAPSRGDSGRPVCACGQTIWRAAATECSDCSMDEAFQAGAGPTLAQRIREAQPDDAPQCAWSTPTSDGEGWR